MDQSNSLGGKLSVFDRKACVRKYYIAHAEQLKAKTKKWYAEHKEQARIYNKKWRDENSKKKKDSDRNYYLAHTEHVKERNKKWQLAHPEQVRTSKNKWDRNHPEFIREKNKMWAAQNPDKVRAYKKWWEDRHPGRMQELIRQHGRTVKGMATRRRINAAKREFGFVPLNKDFQGSEGHHINTERVIYVPKEMHKSVSHSILKNRNMEKINMLVFNWLEAEELYAFQGR